VTVTATDIFFLAGTSPNGTFPSGIFAAQGTATDTGNAGSIVVQAPRVILTEGARISSSTRGPGQGGTVRVTAEDTLTLTGRNSSLRTTAEGSGIGGNIAVQAHQVQFTDGAAITAESAGTGNAGSVTIIATASFLSEHGAVTTTATEAAGGAIRIMAGSLVMLRGSDITASVTGGAGGGGDVTLMAPTLQMEGGDAPGHHRWCRCGWHDPRRGRAVTAYGGGPDRQQHL